MRVLLGGHLRSDRRGPQTASQPTLKQQGNLTYEHRNMDFITSQLAENVWFRIGITMQGLYVFTCQVMVFKQAGT